MDGNISEKERIENTELRLQIERYLHSLPPEVLEVPSCEQVEVLEISHGTYNVNYHVCVAEKDFIFRISIEQQSGLANQIEYEFNTLRHLDGYDIAPKGYHLDNTRICFNFGILIEEFFHGPHVNLVEDEMPAIANLIARLHGIPPDQLPQLIWNDPLVDNYHQVEADLLEYEAKITPDREIIRLTREFLARFYPLLERYHHWFAPDGLNHTDMAIDNFIKTTKGLRLIDWEKPRLDDCTFDVCCFLCEPAQLWCTPQPLSQRGREKFLNAYIRLNGREEAQFLEKIRIREPIVSMHWVLWGSNRLCALRDGHAATDLQEVLQTKVERLKRLARPQNVVKQLQMINDIS